MSITAQERVDQLVERATQEMPTAADDFRTFVTDLLGTPHHNHVWMPYEVLSFACAMHVCDTIQLERLRNDVYEAMVQQSCNLVADKDKQPIDVLIRLHAGYNVALDVKEWVARK